MIFTSNRPNSNIPNEFGIYDQNIYSSHLEDRNFRSSAPISELNTSSNDVSGGLAFDGQRLLLFKNEEGNDDVYESKSNGITWSKPVRKMGEKIEEVEILKKMKLLRLIILQMLRFITLLTEVIVIIKTYIFQEL